MNTISKTTYLKKYQIDFFVFTGYLRRKQQNDDLGLLMEERVPDHLSGKGVFAFETK